MTGLVQNHDPIYHNTHTHPPTNQSGSAGGPRLALLYLGLYLATNEPLSLPETHPLLALYLSKGLTLVMGLWALCLSWDMLQLFVLRTWREGPQVRADPTLVSVLGFARYDGLLLGGVGFGMGEGRGEWWCDI